MDHLLNCHGEWFLLLNALAALPLVGAWARARIVHNHTTHTHTNTNTTKE